MRSAKDCRPTSMELKNAASLPVTKMIFIAPCCNDEQPSYQSNDGRIRRKCLMPPRRFLPSMRRSREALVGRVGRVFAVAGLGAVTLRDNDENAVARQPRSGEPFQPRGHVGRKRRRMPHVEA